MKSLPTRTVTRFNVRKEKTRNKPVVTKETFEKMMGQVRSLADAIEKETRSRKDTDVIRVASDCTGLGSEIIALALLGLLPRVISVAWSDIDKEKQKLYRCVCAKLKHEVGTLEMDMTQSNLELDGCTSKSRNVDLYVAGYPCPSLSTLGRKKEALIQED